MDHCSRLIRARTVYISYAPVFHMNKFGLKSKVKQCPSPEGEKAPHRTDDPSFKRCGHEQSRGVNVGLLIVIRQSG